MSEWCVAPLGEIANIAIGGTPARDNQNYWDPTGQEGYPWVSIADLGPRFVTDTKERITKDGVRFSNVKPVPRDTLLLSFKLTIGRAGIAGRDLFTNEAIAAIRPLPGTVSPKFLYYVLPSIAKNSVTDTAIKGVTLNKQKLASLVVRFPKKIEIQKSIADILETVDITIEKTEALIAKYQQIKAGLMHDLFTRGVTANGKLRPPREQAPELYQETPLGWIPKAWKVKLLSAVVEFLDGKRVPLKEDDRSKIPGHIPYYGASGIIDYIDKWLFDDELILLGEDGENIVSRNLPLAFKVTGKCWVNNHAHVLKPKAGHSISYWTEQLEWKDYAALTSGSAQPKITQGKLANMMVVVPLFIEQEAISERTESMGNHIATEKTFLRNLLQLKHGLMHDLLTGYVRVPAEVSTMYHTSSDLEPNT